MRTQWNILSLGGVILLALVFGLAGVSLIVRSSETADLLLGVFIICLIAGSLFWGFRRRSWSHGTDAVGLDPDSIDAIDEQIVALCQRRQYDRAEELARDALAATETVLGADHANVAARLSALAAILDTQGKYESAEPLYRRALAINESALGFDHLEVADVLENLATLLQQTSRNTEAAAMRARATAIRQSMR